MTDTVLASQPHRSLRALIVDDSPSISPGIRQFLLIQPGIHTVTTAMAGREAINTCRHSPPDLMVMDIRMPELDGMKCATRIRRELPHVRILLTNVDQGADLESECQRIGADSFLPKIGLQRNLMNEIHRLFPDRFLPPEKPTLQ